jgi:hypothetical protein
MKTWFWSHSKSPVNILFLNWDPKFFDFQKTIFCNAHVQLIKSLKCFDISPKQKLNTNSTLISFKAAMANLSWHTDQISANCPLGCNIWT